MDTALVKMVVKKGSHLNKDLKEEVKQQVMRLSGRKVKNIFKGLVVESCLVCLSSAMSKEKAGRC